MTKIRINYKMDRESFFQPPQGKILRAPNLKRGKPEERITDRVSFFRFSRENQNFQNLYTSSYVCKQKKF